MGCCASVKAKGNDNNERVLKTMRPVTEPGTGGQVTGPRGSFMVDNPDDEVMEIRPNVSINPSGSQVRLQFDDPQISQQSPRASNLGSQRGSGRRRFGTVDLNSTQIPLPSKLQLHHEIINLTIAGNLTRIKKIFQESKITEIVNIRGANFYYEDLNDDENEEMETHMWNPLHFAVYHQHLHIIKYFVQDLKVNIAITAPNAIAESEKDPTNSVKQFQEDKILLLLLAFTKRNAEIISYLLNELWYFWTKSIIEHLITKKFFESMQHSSMVATGQKPWKEFIPIILRS